MSPISEMEDSVVRGREEVLRKLVHEQDQHERERLVDQLKLADEMLARLPRIEVVDHRYRLAKYHRPIDAVWHVFKESDRVWTKDDMAYEVERGGFVSPKGATRSQVQRSMGAHKIGTVGKRGKPPAASSTPLALKEISGFWGPAEWPDDKFTNEKPRS